MPIHDWTLVDAGLFHHFHQDWTIELCRALNAGLRPLAYTALTDRQINGPETQVKARFIVVSLGCRPGLGRYVLSGLSEATWEVPEGPDLT